MPLKLLGGDLEALARDALGEFCRRSRAGGIEPLRIGLKRGWLVSDPALIRQVLLDNIGNYDKRTPSFDAVRIVLGNGMLTSERRFARSGSSRAGKSRRTSSLFSPSAPARGSAWGRASR